MADARSGAELTDYSKVAFSADGVRQEISIDDWRNGWAAIVGGLNGKPTSQQFNMVFYVLSVLMNQNISDVSAVKNTANAALPKESFTAKQIVALLSKYGLVLQADAINIIVVCQFTASNHRPSLLTSKAYQLANSVEQNAVALVDVVNPLKPAQCEH